MSNPYNSKSKLTKDHKIAPDRHSNQAYRRKCQCEKKKSFSCYTLAAKEQKFVKRRFGDSLDIYRCKFCQNWHLGHSDLN